MGSVQEVPPAALVAGILYAGDDVYSRTVDILRREYGPVGMESPPFPFDMTDYYTEEMGGGLIKRFVCFTDPILLERLPGIKLFTNAVESDFAVHDGEHPCRRINIDPGYVTMSKLVLATTKDYSHRIYIGEGIFAETTLRFLRGSFMPLDTTYPDYKTPLALTFFNDVRDFVKRNRHQWTRKSE